jgi:WD40 repeat protein
MKRIASISVRYVPALFVCLLFSAGTWLSAQNRRPTRVFTRVTDIVYSTQFSPDGRTLAIARGAPQAYRVELWDFATGTLRHVISGFEGTVWSVSYTPDGRTLVTSSVEFHASKIQQPKGRRPEGKVSAELKWWDAQTGELKQKVTLPGEAHSALMAFHSPDGKVLVTVDYHYAFFAFNADLKLLDAQTGQLRLKLKQDLFAFALSPMYGQFDPLYILLNLRRQRVAVSPGGHFIAYWNAKEVRLWNTATGEETLKLNDFKQGLRGVAFAPVRETLALAITTSSNNKKNPTVKSEIRLYDAATGTVKQTLAASTQVISCLAFANQRQMMIGGWQNTPNRFATLELMDLQDGSLGTLRTGDDGSVSVITLTANGRGLAFQSDVTAVNLVDTQTWTIKHTLDENNDSNTDQRSVSRFLLSVKRVLALAFSANGKTIAAEIEEGGIKVWDPRTGEMKNQIGAHEDAATVVDISSNGTTAAEVLNQESLRLWDLGSSEKKIVSTSGEPISVLALSSDGRTVAIGRANKIALISTATREPIQTLTGHGSEIKHLAFAVDGRTLATASEDGSIQTWDLASGQITRTMTSGGKITALRFAPNGRTLASANENGSVSLWDLQTGVLSLQLKKHSGGVNAIAFSADGNLMATGGDDRSVIIWEIASGKARRTLKDHDLAVTALAFSPDGSLLASGAGNTSVVLWDVPTGKLNRVLK